jgi:hypothetical protein
MENEGNESGSVKFIITVVVILVVAVLVFLFLNSPSDQEIDFNLKDEAIFDEIEKSPTAEEVVPKTNPFSGDNGNTNPFDNYKNPFE